ncbi:MAG: outer membrane protein assembly factor BamD [Akkermansia sp.]|nr:outer membrane protein assembly factor BamD [Akkermansia sp.]
MNRRAYIALFLGAVVMPLLTQCGQGMGELVPAGMVRAREPEAELLMLKAKAAIKENDWGDARSYLQKIVRGHRLAPNAAEAQLLLGDVHRQLGNYRDAFKQYDTVVQSYQNSSLYEQALNRQLSLATDAATGKLQVPVFWGAWEAPMDSSVVEEWLRKVISNAPYDEMSATAASVLAKYLVDIDRPYEAIGAYSELAQKYPDSKYAPGAQLMVGKLWAQSRTRGDRNPANLRHAQEAYEDFCLRFPNHAGVREAKAGVQSMRSLLVQQQLDVGRYYLERAKEYDSAIFCFRDVIRQKADNPEAAKVAATLLQQAEAAKKANAR